VRGRRTLSVVIPAGIADGMSIRLEGEGEVGQWAGDVADLYIHVTQRPHPDFTRDGDDLHVHVTVPSETAAAGGTARVPTLTDGDKTVRIPPGVESGQALRLTGLGVPHLTGEGRGDLFVHVDIDA
jgi:molecular chaperone DnaJ